MTRLRLIVAIFLMACGCRSADKDANTSEISSAPGTEKTATGRVYGIESATIVIERTMTFPGRAGKPMVMTSTETQRFADWGQKEIVVDGKLQIGTMKILDPKTTVIYTGLLHTNIDHKTQSGTQTMMKKQRRGGVVDVGAMINAKGRLGAKQDLERIGLELLPDEEIAGVRCHVVKQIGRNHSTMWIYKGLMLKVDAPIKANDRSPKASHRTISFEQGVKHGPEVFAVPEGIKLGAPMTEEERIQSARERLEAHTKKRNK